MTPAMPTATGSQAAPTDAGGDDAGGDAQVTLKICLERLSDGSFRVYKEPATDGGLPSAGAEGGEPEGGEDVQTAPDLEGALKLVMDIEGDNADDNSPASQFSAGFQSEKADGY